RPHVSCTTPSSALSSRSPPLLLSFPTRRSSDLSCAVSSFFLSSSSPPQATSTIAIMNVTMNAKNFLIHKTSFLLIVRPFNHIFYNRCKKYGVYFIGPNISTSITHKQKVIHSCEWITLHHYSKLAAMAWIISCTETSPPPDRYQTSGSK